MQSQCFHKTELKLNLINILADGKFHSIEGINYHLGLSKLSLINNINELEKWGINVFFCKEKKQCKLLKPLILLNEQVIKSKLGENTILFKPVLNSTNQYLLDNISTIKCGDLCITEYQIFGRGRYGRSWFSPFGCNLYMSIYWQIKQNISNIKSVGLVIGVIIAETLKLLGVNDVRLKWPNDVYVNESKLAGILVELNNTVKTKENTKVIIGVGINVNMANINPKNMNIFPTWISLEEIGLVVDRTDLAINLTNNFRKSLNIFEKYGFVPFKHRWKILDNFINRWVKLIINDKEIYGIARGVDNYGALLLENNGKIKSWSLGEISLRSFY
ncbi:bifunctional biotin--[acetyl-CoA-carboxylase] ligase/biotin operon repressor BirA [Pantoea sp. SoEX]|uniref:bifunctional biotin--[acetyl-CoA-carboxylase] ligase/biotin operon repressor BirA n=1 Tax=Pantoea sp. SoEX TaxID=2576763 RepID=UPI00135A449F|nr:bifunctional biotin--[acetyl-CoA-carboxylase] ligase/biotin operon repressor BirA [Pantoea sp. SoEX]MXP50794.1 bifunctional biotin--[acetyl-CoA-carboxylase] ligase/biotin operon repressor BirA [Pantoea sp. SoEX]